MTGHCRRGATGRCDKIAAQARQIRHLNARIGQGAPRVGPREYAQAVPVRIERNKGVAKVHLHRLLEHRQTPLMPRPVAGLDVRFIVHREGQFGDGSIAACSSKDG
jgi:hypothetical protein